MGFGRGRGRGRGRGTGSSTRAFTHRVEDCHHFARTGRCAYGKKCKFNHHISTVLGSNSDSNSSRRTTSSSSSSSYYATGYASASRNDNLRLRERRGAGTSSSRRYVKGTSITPCVAYTAKGYCPALNRQCPYFHEGIDCNRFVRGDCFFGSRCKFRHRPALRESESAERPHQPHQTHIRNKAVTNQRVVVINQDSSLSVSNRTALSSDHESSGKEASLSTTVTSFPQIEFTGIPDDITDSRSLHPSKSSDDTPSAGHVQSEKLSISMQVDPSTVMSTELEEGERQESAPHINLAHNMSDDVVSNDASAGGTSSKKYFQQKSELKLRDNVPPYNHRSDHAAQEQPQLLRSASRHRNVDYRVRESYRRREYPPKQYPTHRSRRSNDRVTGLKRYREEEPVSRKDFDMKRRKLDYPSTSKERDPYLENRVDSVRSFHVKHGTTHMEDDRNLIKRTRPSSTSLRVNVERSASHFTRSGISYQEPQHSEKKSFRPLSTVSRALDSSKSRSTVSSLQPGMHVRRHKVEYQNTSVFPTPKRGHSSSSRLRPNVSQEAHYRSERIRYDSGMVFDRRNSSRRVSKSVEPRGGHDASGPRSRRSSRESRRDAHSVERSSAQIHVETKGAHDCKTSSKLGTGIQPDALAQQQEPSIRSQKDSDKTITRTPETVVKRIRTVAHLGVHISRKLVHEKLYQRAVLAGMVANDWDTDRVRSQAKVQHHVDDAAIEHLHNVLSIYTDLPQQASHVSLRTHSKEDIANKAIFQSCLRILYVSQ